MRSNNNTSVLTYTPSDQPQGHLQKEQGADAGNCITDHQMPEDNEISLGSGTAEKVLYLPYRTKKSIKTISKRQYQ
jgi:hypothetical protein